MKIRTRLTLWYAAILIVSLIIIGIGTYDQIHEQFERGQHHQVVESPLGETGEMIFEVGLPAVILGLLGGWWITRKALAPVTALTQAVEKIHDRNLREQLPRTGNGDDLDRLTEVFNAMTMRLDDSFQRIREFTLHASHELKTPLTILRGEMELFLNEKNFTDAQREKLFSQIDEVERLAKIVDGLTLLTKADSGQIQLKNELISLDELVQEAFADTKILAQPSGIEVRVEACEPITIIGDRHRLRQLLLNLTDNATKYNQPAGKINICLRRKNEFAELQITNTGAGVAPDLQPRIFERFFRANQNNSIEGCGLGLSIAHWIVTAHNGKIHFTSEPDKLTTVTVQFPDFDTPVTERQKRLASAAIH